MSMVSQSSRIWTACDVADAVSKNFLSNSAEYSQEGYSHSSTSRARERIRACNCTMQMSEGVEIMYLL